MHTPDVERLPLGLARFSELRRDPPPWFWPAYVPRNGLTLVDGPSGAGVSLLLCELAARASSGALLPDGSLGGFGRPVDVLVLTPASDALSGPVARRLMAAGAHLDRLHCFSSVGLLYEAHTPSLDDTADLERAIIATHAEVVVVDDLTAFLSSSSRQALRRAVEQLAQVALRCQVALIVACPLGQTPYRSPLGQAGSSPTSPLGPAQSVLLLAADPHDLEGEQRVLLPLKATHTAPPPVLGFTVRAGWEGTPALAWRGPLAERPAGLEAAREIGRPGSVLREAIRFLQAELQAGPVAVGVLKLQAKHAGIGFRTLVRAKAALRASSIPERDRYFRGWKWQLPEPAEPVYTTALEVTLPPAAFAPPDPGTLATLPPPPPDPALAPTPVPPTAEHHVGTLDVPTPPRSLRAARASRVRPSTPAVAAPLVVTT